MHFHFSDIIILCIIYHHVHHENSFKLGCMMMYASFWNKPNWTRLAQRTKIVNSGWGPTSHHLFIAWRTWTPCCIKRWLQHVGVAGDPDHSDPRKPFNMFNWVFISDAQGIVQSRLANMMLWGVLLRCKCCCSGFPLHDFVWVRSYPRCDA